MGPLVFFWSASDGGNYALGNALVAIDITAINDAPAVANITKSGTEDTPLPFSEADFDTKFTDPEGESLYLVKFKSLPANGTLKLNGVNVAVGDFTKKSAMANLVFIPNANWNGTTSFTWNGSDLSSTYAAADATVNITINAVNDAPVAYRIYKTGTEDTQLVFSATDFTSKFSDVDGNSMTKAKIVSLTANGTLKLNGVDILAGQEILTADLSKITFTPNANWNGVTTFDWNGHDGTSYAVKDSLVQITIGGINDIPTVADFSKVGPEDTPIAFAATDFSTKFSDIDNNVLNKIKIVSLPANGALKLGGATIAAGQEIAAANLANITFVPTADWSGNTSFLWNGSDGSAYAVSNATVSIKVDAVNDLPIVSYNKVSGIEDMPIAFDPTHFKSSFTDADGDVLARIKIASLPLNGVLRFNGATVTIGDEITTADISKLTFDPSLNWNGNTSFLWNGSDGTAYANSHKGANGILVSSPNAEMAIAISPVDDPATINSIAKSGPEDAAIPFTSVDFISKFLDVDGPLVKIKVLSLPANGTLLLKNAPVATNAEIIVADLADLSFVPNPNWNGTTGFTWNGFDGANYTVSGASVNITISPLQDAPTLQIVNKTGTEDTPLAFAALDFTSKFTDADNEVLTKVKVLTLPTNGVLKLNGVNVNAGQEILSAELNNLSFIPNTNWNGFTSFNWNASDGTDYAVNYVEARISINPVDDPAVLTDIVKSGNEDVVIAFTEADFKSNFTDPDGSLTQIKVLTLPANGALKFDGALLAVGDEISAKFLDKITFTPKAEWNGSTSFGWNASIDPVYDTPGANVLITVNPLSDKPVISDFTKNGIEDTPLVFAASDFTTRFTDVDGDALTKIVVNTLPANGILKLNGVAVMQDQSINTSDLGNLTFVPDANWHDRTNFEWEAYDGTEYSTTKAKVYIIIDGVDDPSTLTSFQKNGQEDTPVSFIAADFTSNFNDVDGGLRVVKIISLPLNGTLKLGVTNITAGQEVSLAELPNISFVPSANWNGSTSFNWNASHGSGYPYAAVEASVDIFISPVNDTPLLTSFPKSGQEDSPVVFTPTDFTSHFSDVDTDALRYVKIISLPLNGTLKLNGVGVVVGQQILPADLSLLAFEPDANWHGTTTFKWNACDNTAYAAIDAEVNIKIDPVDDPATVSDFTKSGQEDTILPFTAADFTSRFNDVDGPLIDIKIISVPANGKLKLNGVDIIAGQVIATANLANLTFVPDPNWNGTTNIKWNATDGTAYAALDATAIINISSVNDAPVVSNFTKSGPEDVTLPFLLSDFTSHFSDGDGGQLTEIRIESLPANGALKLTGSSAYNLSVGTEINAADLANLVFVPNANWYGTTKFKWKGSDLDWSLADAEVTINITTVDDPATVAGFSKSGPEDATISFLASDFTTKFNDADGALAKVKVTSLPANGKLKLSSTDVTIGQEIVLADLANITFVPDVNWNGSTSFTWNATESTNYAAVDAKVDITVNGVNDLPSVRNFFKSGPEDATLIFTSSDFTTRFTDPDNDLLTAVKIVSLPADGKLKLNGVNITSGQTIPEASLANITFVPDADWNGTTVFNWNAIDGTVYALTDATVTITISAQPDAPVISDINKTGKKNKQIAFSDVDFTSQFIDPDNDALNKIKVTSLPADGTLKLDGTAILVNQEILFADLSKLSFEPSLDWFGRTSFDWEASDGALYSSSARVHITVNDVLPPTAVHDNKVVNANMPEAINVLQNDVEGDLSINPSSIEVVSQPLNGQAKENVDGTITYSPKNNFIGSDSFTYQVKDTDGILSNIATVTITVAGVQLTNVFTPNGDGKNDTFVIVGLENFDNADLAVYNRWGNEVYRNGNYKNTWDGDGLNDGTYYYIIKVKKASNQETRKGWILIKRN